MRCWLILTLFMVANLAHAQAPDAGVAAITADGLLADVTHLAGPQYGGRLSGSDGYLAAARWAADRFAALGLQPGGDDGYLQTLTIEYNAIVGTPRLSVRCHDGAWTTCALGPDFTCRGFTGSGAVAAPVVFVGYGLSEADRGFDDYAGVDIRGKVALCFKRNPDWTLDDAGWSAQSATPRARAATAIAHGAVALLWVDAPSAADAPPPVPIGSVLHGDGDHHPDFPHLEIGETVADRLLGGAGDARRLRRRIDADHRPQSFALPASVDLAVQARYETQHPTWNVVAVLPGSDPIRRDEALVIGGHLDHVGRQSPDVTFPGANDNASGASAVLALSAAFARADRPPARTVVFVLFASEESGLEGSRFHAAHPFVALDHTTAMFNLDCVAHGDSIKVGGGDGAPELWRLARELDASHARRMVKATWKSGGADAQPFADLGVRTLYWVTTNSYTYLHQPADRPVTLDGALYADLVRLAFRTSWAVADAP